jgi:hypothetical protein
VGTYTIGIVAIVIRNYGILPVGTIFTEMFAAYDRKPFQSCFSLKYVPQLRIVEI